MSISIDNFSGFKIVVTNIPSVYYDGSYWTEYSSEFKQTTDRGESISLHFELDSINVDRMSGSANFHYERSGLNTNPPSFRRGIVKIGYAASEYDDQFFFIGVIVDQINNNNVVSLNAISLLDIINNLDIRASYINDNSYSDNWSIYNEQGKKDMSEDYYCDSDLSKNPEYWKMNDVAINFIYTIWDFIGFGNEYVNYFTIDDIVSSLEELTGVLVPNDFTLNNGIIDYIDNVAKSNELLSAWNIVRHGDGPDYLYKFALSFYSAGTLLNAKTITMKKNPITADEIPYDVSINCDFDSPSELYLYSGNTYIHTLLKINPSGSYATIEQVDTDGNEKIIIKHDGISNEIFEGLEFSDLPSTQKRNTWINIMNNINNIDDLTTGRDIKLSPNQNIYIKFKQTYKGEDSFDSGFAYKDSDILVDGYIWNTAIEQQKEGIISKVSQFDIDRTTGAMEVTITAPLKNDAENGGVDGELTCANFQNMVDYIYIPITLISPHRMVVKASRTNVFDLVIESENVTQWEPDKIFAPFELYPEKYVHEIRNDDYIHQVYRIKDIENYNNNVIKIRDDSIAAFDIINELMSIAESKLKDDILSDGSSATIVIPIELYFKLSSSYPKNFGDKLFRIVGDSNTSGYDLPRVLTLSSISLNNSTASLEFN